MNNQLKFKDIKYGKKAFQVFATGHISEIEFLSEPYLSTRVDILNSGSEVTHWKCSTINENKHTRENYLGDMGIWDTPFISTYQNEGNRVFGTLEQAEEYVAKQRLGIYYVAMDI